MPVRSTATRPHSLAMLSSAETADRAIQGGLPEAGHDPAVPLRVPCCDEGVEAVGDGLGTSDELCLRAPAPSPVLLRVRHRRDWGGINRDLAPLERAGAAAKVDLVCRRTIRQLHGADVLPDVAAHGIYHAPGHQDHEGTDRERSLHLATS